MGFQDFGAWYFEIENQKGYLDTGSRFHTHNTERKKMPVFIPPVVARITDNFAAHLARKSVNPGTDYACPVGTPVVSVGSGDGVVTKVVNTITGAGGRMVNIKYNSYEWNVDYLHLSRIDVQVGQIVQQGQVIGLSGASGKGSERGYGPHLHFSFRSGNAPFSGASNQDFEAILREWGVDKAPAAPAAKGTKAPAAAPVAPAAPVARPTIKKGSKGPDVVYLQQKLGIGADGAFGPITKKAVVAFQKSRGLVADGIVGPITWKAIG
jgi:murein DD-endopeptidase MepM/ murein hydrolase activator NlpD